MPWLKIRELSIGLFWLLNQLYVGVLIESVPCILFGEPDDSILDATFTVLPQISNWGFRAPGKSLAKILKNLLTDYTGYNRAYIQPNSQLEIVKTVDIHMF